jgi:hypothetical protein
MLIRCWTGALALVLLAASTALGQQAPAGRIKLASGSAVIVRQGGDVPATQGSLVFEGDAFRTGADGRLGITLKDDSRISLGPNTEARLDRFLFAPGRSGVGLAVSFLRGVAAYVSGRIAKLSPDSVRLETPSAILGIRGTRVAIRVD